jgi:hypothetical protein
MVISALYKTGSAMASIQMKKIKSSRSILFVVMMFGITGINCSTSRLNKKEGPIASPWQTYSSPKGGFSFQYPSAWIKKGNDVEVMNPTGNLTAIEANFIDTITKTSLLVSSHLTPASAELYAYALSQYDPSRGDKYIEVSGSKALESIRILAKDGKGNELHPALKLMTVQFMDKDKNGEIELQFKTPENNFEQEVIKFDQVLKSFKFFN